MNWQLLWFVLAGLVLGFALSTLWEWFYFRRERMIVRDERITELQNQVRAYEQRDRDQAVSSHWPAPAYQSPGVLLESERVDERADLAAEDAARKSSEPVTPLYGDTDESEFSQPEPGASEVDEFEFAMDEAEEDDLSEPDPFGPAVVAATAIAATAVTAGVLSGDEGEEVEADEEDIDEDVYESLERAPYLVSTEAHTDDEELEMLAAAENAIDERAEEQIDALSDEEVEQPADESIAESIYEPTDEQAERQDDSLAVASDQDAIDELIIAKTAAVIHEEVGARDDEASESLIDEGENLGSEEWAERLLVEDIDEQTRWVDAELEDNWPDDTIPDDIRPEDFRPDEVGATSTDEPAKALPDEPIGVPVEASDEPLDDEAEARLGLVRVDDLISDDEPAKALPDEPIGVSVEASDEPLDDEADARLGLVRVDDLISDDEPARVLSDEPIGVPVEASDEPLDDEADERLGLVRVDDLISDDEPIDVPAEAADEFLDDEADERLGIVRVHDLILDDEPIGVPVEASDEPLDDETDARLGLVRVDDLIPDDEPTKVLPDEPIGVVVEASDEPLDDETDARLGLVRVDDLISDGEPAKALPDESIGVWVDASDEPLDDETDSRLGLVRVDDLISEDEPVGRSADGPEELLGAALLSAALVDAKPVVAEPDAATDEPAGWKPEEIRGHPDNLSRVKGIGKTYRRRLYDAGIFTWHQLGQMSEDEIRQIVHPFVSADVEEWPQRARLLAERNGRIGAQYVGPMPDDLAEIRGIGSYAMQRLYKGGIWSFQQLAALSPEELEAIIPISPSGGAIDHQRWIDDAGRLAEERDG